MKKSEVIKTYRSEIESTMINRFRNVMDCDNRIQYKVYIYDDGEIECLEGPSGDNSWLKANDADDRELHYVTTVTGINPWDCIDASQPEDENERDAVREEIINSEVASYKGYASDVIDEVINEAEMIEKYGS